MRRIQSLPSAVINKIAAGEVIERPASVVKELLENSLDAGSTRIEIDVEQGGAELIRIVDNGSGIHAEDMRLAFANHATSKLKDADDLFSVRTMGFRGEALASIGGIAQVTLQSRPADSDIGSELTCNGSVLGEMRPWNGSPGTRIEVRHLFYNTPVRRKFLKSPGTEIGHICEIFTRIALANPNLHLVLRHNGKNVYEVPTSANLKERLRLFFGKELGENLFAIEKHHQDCHLFGFIGDPAFDKGNAKLQYLFLNGRWIRDRSLGHAVQEGYRGLLMTGRYPVSFLFLELPADQVDVNVHPTKAEVRFREGSALYGFFLSAVRDRLREENLTARFQPSTTPMPFFQPRPIEATSPLFPPTTTGFPSFTRVPTNGDARAEGGGGRAEETRGGGPPATTIASEGEPGCVSAWSASREESAPLPEADSTSVEQAEALNAIQVHNTYIVVETVEGMLVIDQHALHERVLFEQIKDRIRGGDLEVQQLLIPEPVELTSEQAGLVLEHRESLGALGLGVEDFGGGTVLVTRYPALLSRRGPGEVLKSIVDHLVAKERTPSREQLLADLMNLMACHGAVRSGDPLTLDEINALVAMRRLAADTHHCPHGRPTALLYTRQELDRQFRRV